MKVTFPWSNLQTLNKIITRLCPHLFPWCQFHPLFLPTFSATRSRFCSRLRHEISFHRDSLLLPDPLQGRVLHGLAVRKRERLAVRLRRWVSGPDPEISDSDGQGHQDLHHAPPRGPPVWTARTFVHAGIADVCQRSGNQSAGHLRPSGA